MTDRMRVYAGECTTEYEGTVDRTARGHAVALINSSVARSPLSQGASEASE